MFGKQFGVLSNTYEKLFAAPNCLLILANISHQSNYLTDSLVGGAGRAANVSRCKLFDRQFGRRGSEGGKRPAVQTI